MAQSNDVTMTENNNFEELVRPEVEVPKTVSPKAAFVAKCLHPPSAVNGFEGLPTNDTRTQVCVEYKGLSLLTASGYLNVNGTITPPAKKPTTFAYLIPAGGMRAQVISYFRDTDNGVWYQDIPNLIRNSTYDAAHMSDDVNLYRPSYKSLTTTLNVTMFNNTGMVAGCQFNPPLLWYGSLAMLAEQKPGIFRDFIASKVRFERQPLVRSSKSKEFFKWPASIRADIADTVSRITKQDNNLDFTTLTLENDPFIIDLNPGAAVQFVAYGDMGPEANNAPVPSLDQILNADVRSSAFPAREGTFTVSKLNTISPSWLTPTNGRGPSVAAHASLYQCYVASSGSDGAYHFIPLQDKGGLTANSTPLYDAQWSTDMTWNWVQYTGLSYNSNQDTVTQQQLIAFKWYAGYEYQPAFMSPFAGLQRMSPRPDIMAMETLLKDFYDMKSVLPSAYNFLGMLARGASKLLPHLIKHAPKVLKVLQGVGNFADNETRRDQNLRNAAKPKAKRPPKAKVEKVLEKIEGATSLPAAKAIAVKADTKLRKSGNKKRKPRKKKSAKPK